MLSNQIQSNKNKGQNRNPKNHKKTLQVKSITKDNVLINQESFSYEKHYSNKKFMLVSKEIGYFNKINNLFVLMINPYYFLILLENNSI